MAVLIAIWKETAVFLAVFSALAMIGALILRLISRRAGIARGQVRRNPPLGYLVTGLLIYAPFAAFGGTLLAYNIIYAAFGAEQALWVNLRLSLLVVVSLLTGALAFFALMMRREKIHDYMVREARRNAPPGSEIEPQQTTLDWTGFAKGIVRSARIFLPLSLVMLVASIVWQLIKQRNGVTLMSPLRDYSAILVFWLVYGAAATAIAKGFRGISDRVASNRGELRRRPPLTYLAGSLVAFILLGGFGTGFIFLVAYNLVFLGFSRAVPPLVSQDYILLASSAFIVGCAVIIMRLRRNIEPTQQMVERADLATKLLASDAGRASRYKSSVIRSFVPRLIIFLLALAGFAIFTLWWWYQGLSGAFRLRDNLRAGLELFGYLWLASAALGSVWSMLFRLKFNVLKRVTPRLSMAGLISVVIAVLIIGALTGLAAGLGVLADLFSVQGSGVAGYAIFYLGLTVFVLYLYFASALIPLLIGMLFGWRLRNIASLPRWLTQKAQYGH
ncbi:MAG: hypothetical protein RIB03_00010 [Henriciella sp.]|uniref:hypothetical protein n=1 Tax=Henriciella sp. TaxID=1968823 RepID=UPI0032ED0C67